MNRLMTLLVAGLAMVTVQSSAEEEVDEDNNRTKTPPSIEEMDTDGDGLVSAEEFDVFRLGVEGEVDEEDEEGGEERETETENASGLSAFASFDKDKDGFVTEEELAAHAKYSNPGNGTGELKTSKQEAREAKAASRNESSSSSSQSSSKGNSGNKGSGGNKGNSGNRGGGNSGGNNKSGKDK
jgi:Ca2+-binding EF-hand superfamily protein